MRRFTAPPALMVILGVTLVAYWSRPGRSQSDLRRDHLHRIPHAYCTADHILTITLGPRSTPFTDLQGRTYWPAYSCLNPRCPRKVSRRLAIFAHQFPVLSPHGDPEPIYNRDVQARCPSCRKAGMSDFRVTRTIPLSARLQLEKLSTQL